jgi:hypothetical protein
MTTKTVYSFDPNTLSFLGTIKLDAGDLSPLDLAEGREVWLLPGNCVEVAPPEHVPAGKYAAAVDGAWEIRDVPVPVGVAAVKTAAEAAPAALAPEMLAASLHAFIERHLEAQARVRRFKTIDEAASYAECMAVPKFYGQARALRTLRGKTWAVAEPLIDAIAAGGEAIKPDDLYKLLPVYDEAEATEAEAAAKLVADHPQPAEAAQPARKAKKKA